MADSKPNREDIVMNMINHQKQWSKTHLDSTLNFGNSDPSKPNDLDISVSKNARYNVVNAEFIASKLIEMPVEQLNCVFDALKAAEDSFLGVLNQPRCVGVAQELIDDLMSELACSRDALVKEAMARELNEQSRDYMLQIRLKYEAQHADDPVNIASIVLRFAD